MPTDTITDVISFLFLSLMALPHMQVVLDARRCLLLIQAMIVGVPPQITGPTILFSAILHFALNRQKGC